MAFLHLLPLLSGALSLFMALLFFSYFLVKKSNKKDVLYITLLYCFGGLVAVFQGLSNIAVDSTDVILYHRLKIFFLFYNVGVLNIFLNRISELKIRKMVIIVNFLFVLLSFFVLFTPFFLKDEVWVVKLDHINMVYRFAKKNILYAFYSLLLFISLFTHIYKHITLKRFKTFRQRTAIISLILLIVAAFNDFGTLYKYIESILVSEYAFFLIPAVYSSILIREIIQNEESAISLAENLEREKNNLEKSKEELEKAKKEIESLNEISLQISKSLDLDNVFENIVSYVRSFFRFEGCALYLCSMDDKTFSLEKYSMPESISPFFESKIDKIYSLNGKFGWLHECMLKNETFFFTNISTADIKNNINRRMVNELNIKSVLFTPIVSEDAVIGAFSLTSHNENIYLSDPDINSIKRFVNQISITVKNSKLYEEIMRERSFSASLIENSPFAILVVNKHLNPLYLNPACFKVLKYSKNEILRNDFFNSPEIVNTGFHDYFGRTLKGEIVYIENLVFRSPHTGGDLILNCTFTPVPNPKGEIDIVLIMFYDNTEKAIAERTLNEDLMLAKHIQSNYITLDTRDINEFEYDVYFSPMMEVGGDIYNVFKINDDYYRVFIADATGHGVQAALTTMIIKAEYDKIKERIDMPNMVLSTLNNSFLYNYIDLNVFFTCVIIDFDLANNKIYYSSAGHPVQFLIRKNICLPLQAGGRMVGILEDIDYKLRTVDFKPGDKAVLFTDGLFEVFNENNLEFGETKLGFTIEQNADKDIKLLIKSIVNEIDSWRGNSPVNDDITLLVVEYS